MSDKEKDLWDAQTKPDPDINFSYNDLLAELVAEYKLEERQPGDVSAEDMAMATGLSKNHCSTLLKGKSEKGELIAVKVKGSKRGTHIIVYRKVIKSNT